MKLGYSVQQYERSELLDYISDNSHTKLLKYFPKIEIEIVRSIKDPNKIARLFFFKRKNEHINKVF